MDHLTFKSGTLSISIRWVARVWSLGSIGLLFLFFVGEGFNPLEITLREWLLLFFFPFGLTLGLILAWWWEGWGGLIATGSVIGFYFAHYLMDGQLPRGPFLILLAVPGLLFLWCWLITHEVAQRV